MCHCILKQFCDSLDGGNLPYKDCRKLKIWTLPQALGTNVHHCAKFNQNRPKGCRYMVIQRFSQWRPSAILDWWNSNFLTVGADKRPILHHRTKFRKDRSNRCGDIAIFVIFQDGGRRHLGFSNIQNLNGWSAARVQHASSRQISSKSVERSQTYGDLTLF